MNWIHYFFSFWFLFCFLFKFFLFFNLPVPYPISQCGKWPLSEEPYRRGLLRNPVSLTEKIIMSTKRTPSVYHQRMTWTITKTIIPDQDWTFSKDLRILWEINIKVILWYWKLLKKIVTRVICKGGGQKLIILR